MSRMEFTYVAEDFKLVNDAILRSREEVWGFIREVVRWYPKDEVAVSRCPNCDGLHFWVAEKMVWPIGSGIRPVEEMPENVKEVFREAQEIMGASPRASCALLRVGLERLLKQLPDAPAKGTLYERINALPIPSTLRPMADALREVGNSAVHSEEIDLSQSNEEARRIAELLSEFLNQLAETMLIRPSRASRLVAMVKALKKR